LYLAGWLICKPLQTASAIGNRQYLTPNTDETQIASGAWLRTYGYRFGMTPSNSTSGAAIKATPAACNLAMINQPPPQPMAARENTMSSALCSTAFRAQAVSTSPCRLWLGQCGLLLQKAAAFACQRPTVRPPLTLHLSRQGPMNSLLHIWRAGFGVAFKPPQTKGIT